MGWFGDAVDAVGGFFKGTAKGLWGMLSTLAAVVGTLGAYIYWGMLTLFNIGRERKKLSPCLQAALKLYYPSISLEEVKIVANADGIPNGFTAVTEGFTIFWQGDFSEKKPDEGKLNPDIMLLLHELVHVVQYKEKGRFSFSLLYTWNSSFHLSYENNPMEVEANEYRATIKADFLRDMNDTCWNENNPNNVPPEELEWLWPMIG